MTYNHHVSMKPYNRGPKPDEATNSLLALRFRGHLHARTQILYEGEQRVDYAT